MSDLFDRYAAKMNEAEEKLGPGCTVMIGSIATRMYAKDETWRDIKIDDPRSAEILAYAKELADMLRAAEPPEMRDL